MADALGTGVQASAELEASRLGAALLALESLGALTDVADAPASFGSYYEPRKEFTKQYQAARLRQEKMYRMLVQGSRHL